MPAAAPNVNPVREISRKLAVSSHSAIPRGLHTSEDTALGVLRRDPHIDPTEFSDVLVPPDVLVEPHTGPMMVAFVVGSHLDVLPANVENCYENPVFVVDRNLGLWPWKTRPDEE